MMRSLQRKTLLNVLIAWKILPLPHIPVQVIYYLRQLWVQKFCINEININNAYFYVHYEGAASKSLNKVCSLQHYIQKAKNKNNIYQNLIIFSDECAGQIKNHCLFRYLMKFTEHNIFKNFTHYYPVLGIHSYRETDLSAV